MGTCADSRLRLHRQSPPTSTLSPYLSPSPKTLDRGTRENKEIKEEAKEEEKEDEALHLVWDEDGLSLSLQGFGFDVYPPDPNTTRVLYSVQRKQAGPSFIMQVRIRIFGAAKHGSYMVDVGYQFIESEGSSGMAVNPQEHSYALLRRKSK